MTRAVLESEVPMELVDYDPFAGGELARVVASTEPQREIWLADQLGSDASLSFNLSVSLRLNGSLDRDALARALQSLVDRHESLRASFDPQGERLCIRKPLPFALVVADLSTLEGDTQREAIDARVRHSVDTPFDVTSDLLFRAELLRLSPVEHQLVLSAHHAACDGWSWWVVVRELGALYAQHAGSPAQPLPPADAYSAYAMAEAQADPRRQQEDEAFWLARFADEVPVLDLPTDRPRPTRRSFASARVDHVLDADLTASLRRLGARRGASLFATLLAGFSTLLGRLAGQDSVVVGIPAAGQAAGGHATLVGHCVNTLPLRFHLDPESGFGASIDAAQDVLLDALEHQRYTFGTLLKKLPITRDPGRMPLVSVMFNIDQALENEAQAFPGLELEFFDNPRSHDTFELFINAAQVQGALRLECQYNRELFDEATVRRWLAAYQSLLRAAVEDVEQLVAKLPLVRDEAFSELLALQPAPVPFDRDCRMHEYFERQCDLTPESVAVRAGGVVLTYAQLEARANRIARLLRAGGARRGTLVGLAVDRDADMLAALLGILKTGAGYVPLDPGFPAERLAYMADDAGLAALVTQRRHRGRVDLAGRPVLVLDELEQALAAQPAMRIGRDVDGALPESVAYVIYTSGSTGRPKGVQVPHGAVSNFLVGMQAEPGITAADRLLAVTTLSFDIAVLELLLPLSVGAQVVVADRDTASDADALSACLRETGATMMQATPATWHLLLEAGWQGGAGFSALCGGEPMAPDLAQQLLARCGALWNLYGPTETTVWSTCTRILPGRDGAPDIHIGRPIANTQVWILDERGELCPRGVPGEICIGGEGVTLGYLDRPELTAERFIADRYDPAARQGARVYRTGDRGRWRADGQLEHHGRLDFQVKVRGHRIELGEIEANLAAHPAVARVVAMAREDRPGDVRLVAYVVLNPGHALDEAAMSVHLRDRLPDYMVPQHLVPLPAIPLLPNGKVDRKALPAPQSAAPAVQGRRAPRGETEQRIAALMAEVLGVQEVSAEDDFFANGGHSLLAARLVSRLSATFATAVPLRVLFEEPTVASLARRLDGSKVATPAPAVAVPALPDPRTGQLSTMQQRLWMLDHMHPGYTGYNIQSAHRLRGTLDPPTLEAAFAEVVRRQPMLRMFIDAEGDGAVQRVLDDVAPALPVEDLSGLPADEREAVAMRRMDELTAEPIPLDQAPLYRVRLFRLSAEEHVLFLMVHHVAWDGMSIDLFCSEMATLYDARCSGRQASLPEPERSYVEFADWNVRQAGEAALDAQVAHWKAHLDGHAEPLQLPEDFPRPAQATGRGGAQLLRVDAASTSALRALGVDADATLFMTLLAAWYVLLHRVTGQRDLVVGLPVRNVPEGLDGVMGYFVNVLPLRMQLDPSVPFSTLVSQVRAAVLDCFSHPDVPLDRLVRELGLPRDASRSPVYQAMFSYQDIRERRGQWGDLRYEHVMLPHHTANQDIALWCFEDHDGLEADLNYSADIMSAESGAQMRNCFLALLEALRREPSIAIGDANLLGGEDRALLAEWNSTDAAWPPQRTLTSLLQAQATASPDRVALRFENSILTYARLHARADSIANALRARGVRAGDLVGVCLDRHLDMVAGLLAVLKAGAGYVPLDPAYPGERLRFMADDAGLALVLSEGDLAQPLEWPRERQLLLDADADEIERAEAIALDASEAAVIESSVAYVIYTSGSTGKPKGVQVPHGAAVNFLESMRHAPGLGSEDKLLAVTTTSFDISVLELFLPLAIGAQVVLASRETAMDGEAIAAVIERDRVDVMQATPSTWHMLLDAGWRPRHPFKALCGGEALSPELATRLLDRGVELWNMYGPTETTVWSTCARVERSAPGAVPDIHVGRPIANTTVWVLDERGQPCPPGVPGEICIGGAGVALGYLGRPELTAEKFFPDRISPCDYGTGLPPRLYRTGDRGRWRRDGVIEHQGRIDFQVKVRGHRIELGEIESRLEADGSVARAVATTREDHPGDVRLVGYVVAAPGMAVDEKVLFEALRSALPPYMVPQHLVVLDAFPLLPNGKVDRKRLPAPMVRRQEASVLEGQSAAVRYLADVWSAALGVDAAPGDNFFDIGGHSMLAVKMANRVQRETGVRLNLLMLASSTLAQIAEALPQDVGAAPVTEGNAPLRMDGVPKQGEGAVPTGGTSEAGAPVLEPFHFGPPDRRLFGLYHAPRGQVRACVLMCPPLLHEQMRSYRFFAGIADQLAASGLACLRFDYFGTWDSGGASEDFHPAQARSDMALAAAALRERAGDVPLVLMGIRASAMLARAEAERLGASALWLWQPVLDAAAYLRELDAFDAVERRSSTRYPFARKGPSADPGELMGFKLASTFREELLALDMHAPVPETPVLVMGAATDNIAGDVRRIDLPDALAAWTGQLELDGLIPLRSAAGAIEALVAESRRWG
ncbi:amino acid adenylation domain-containing protein [Luteimonas soli]|uniref:Amino acid adenylation domain-containing protein n=1 Tax=Luteimonas soli TaxID=1648966 RepID=A0ABV7XIZ1_9GAMM